MVVFRPTEQSLIFIQREKGNGFQFEIQKAMIASFEITGKTLSITTCNITNITIVQYCEKQCKWHSAKFKGFLMERIKVAYDFLVLFLLFCLFFLFYLFYVFTYIITLARLGPQSLISKLMLNRTCSKNVHV